MHQPSALQTTSGNVPVQFESDASGGGAGKSFVRQLSDVAAECFAQLY